MKQATKPLEPRLRPVSVRAHAYAVALMDDGWDAETAFKYARRRFGRKSC